MLALIGLLGGCLSRNSATVTPWTPPTPGATLPRATPVQAGPPRPPT
ncbi:MAG: hypothetical protein GXO37_03120, partial [Chloroflexi bacterium]|nr:hypothetical protein [Chloroflexota bacterium]